MRRAAKVDTAQQSIVDGLRSAGYRVEIIGRPVDLLVGKMLDVEIALRDRRCWTFYWRLLEIKTPTKSGKRSPRADQEAQDTFIRETGTAVVTTLDEALKALEGL